MAYEMVMPYHLHMPSYFLETFTEYPQIKVKEPVVGTSEPFEFEDRTMRLYRMPSSSRAYPLPIEKKSAIYRVMFNELGLLNE